MPLGKAFKQFFLMCPAKEHLAFRSGTTVVDDLAGTEPGSRYPFAKLVGIASESQEGLRKFITLITCNATVGLHGHSPDPHNEAIGSKFRHLVVNTSQTPYERSITNNRTPISLVKIGYRLLGHLPDLP
ncbi:hypothetical protein M9H77_07052 [Catharanthus roseus]|uniref:Uncharacterized protein n=1 Tax=Catharanthus roseus TaxID=4058 RepID=A0ACC0BTT9_CATRO|nr:hypothetical protein M9H77_07052 [Catharanthus roseus]